MKRKIMPKGIACAAVICCLMAAAGTVSVFADDMPPASKTAQIMKLLEEGVTHYKVGEYDLAADKFERILELEPSSEVALMMRQRAGVDLLVSMLQRKEMADKAYQILRLSQQELEVKRRDPNEIREMIKQLIQPEVVARARVQRELVAVGEFAVPFLLDLLDVDQEELYGFTPRERVTARASAQLVLEMMRNRAVLPLIEGLNTGNEGLKVQICRILGGVRDARAVPALKALVEKPGAPAAAVAAASDALAEIAKSQDIGQEISAAQVYLALAESYYYGDPRVIDYVPNLERTLWVWTGQGRSYADRIVVIEVPQYAYNELMAEKLICHGLGHVFDKQAVIESLIPGKRLAPDDVNRKLLALMAANNYAQLVEARLLGSGAPVVADLELPAKAREEAAARAEELKSVHLVNRLVGSPAIHDALARQLKDGDFEQALEAIADLKALADTSVPDVENALAMALNAPSMQVRYRATEALMAVWPVGDLGAEGSAIAEEARNMAVANVIAASTSQAVPHVLIVTGDRALFQKLSEIFTGMNCTTERAATLSEAVRRAKAELPFVTMFVVDSRNETLEIIGLMREDAVTRYIPAMVLAPAADVPGIQEKFADRVADVLAITARESAIVNSARATLSRSMIVTQDPVAGARQRLDMMLESVAALPAHTGYPIDASATAITALFDGQPNEVRIRAAKALKAVAHPTTLPPLVAIFLNAKEPEALRVAAGQAAVEALLACSGMADAPLPAADVRKALLSISQNAEYSSAMRDAATRLYSIIPPSAN